MAKFKSTYNGTIIEFTNENDIAELRKHTSYVEVKDNDEWIEKEAGHHPARTLDTSPVSLFDKKTGVSIETGVRRRRKG